MPCRPAGATFECMKAPASPRRAPSCRERAHPAGGSLTTPKASHLDGAAVLALPADCGEVTLQDLNLKALFQQAHCQHEAADAAAGNHHFHRWLAAARECRGLRACRGRGCCPAGLAGAAGGGRRVLRQACRLQGSGGGGAAHGRPKGQRLRLRVCAPGLTACRGGGLGLWLRARPLHRGRGKAPLWALSQRVGQGTVFLPR